MSARAMAIMARWRIPPENSCGHWRARCSGCGMPTRRRRFTDSRKASFFEISRCVTKTSEIWFPTRWTGLRAVRGSWKIMLTLSPRNVRISSGGSFRRSTPRNRTCPEMRASFLVTRPITVSQLTLLPEPDSPTTPSVSPG